MEFYLKNIFQRFAEYHGKHKSGVRGVTEGEVRAANWGTERERYIVE